MNIDINLNTVFNTDTEQLRNDIQLAEKKIERLQQEWVSSDANEKVRGEDLEDEVVTLLWLNVARMELSHRRRKIVKAKMDALGL